jgi:protein required for attachment to host cells
VEDYNNVVVAAPKSLGEGRRSLEEGGRRRSGMKKKKIIEGGSQ